MEVELCFAKNCCYDGGLAHNNSVEVDKECVMQYIRMQQSTTGIDTQPTNEHTFTKKVHVDIHNGSIPSV